MQYLELFPRKCLGDFPCVWETFLVINTGAWQLTEVGASLCDLGLWLQSAVQYVWHMWHICYIGCVVYMPHM